MSNTILLKRSSTTSKIPLAADLQLGELALNTFDGKIFMLKNNGTNSVIEVGAVTTVSGRTGAIVLVNADVSGSAPIASPSFTGSPVAPTPDPTSSTTAIATTAFVKNQLYITSSGAPVQSVSGRTGTVVLTSADVGLNLVENKTSTTIRSEITLSNITTALGYTPSKSSDQGVANGLATLDSTGKIVSTQLPSITIADTFVVASQTAMLALTAQTGDVAVRTDLNKSFIVKGTDGSVIGNWQELLTPTDAVLSVAGRTGSVVLSNTDVSGSAPLASPTFTGTVSAPTPATSSNTTVVATTAFVKAQGYATTSGSGALAPVQSVAGRNGDVVLTITDISGTVDGGSF